MTSEQILSLVESAALDAAVEPPAGVAGAGVVGAGASGVAGAAVAAGGAGAAGVLTVTVPADRWLALLALARDGLGCDFFDWLSGVDEADAGVAVLAHVYSLAGRHHLLLRTVLAGDQLRLPTATGIYRGAAWHERETEEMFGVIFDGHPRPGPLLLPEGFEGHPLRKDFPLAARAAQEWPGAREPGEPAWPGQPARGRRRAVPPGVPEGWPAG